jgi:chlorobactene glucosyltransferase
MEQIASLQPRLKVLAGSSPPEGQFGKNWACVQLAQQARGDLLFFTDADTCHRPQSLRELVTALVGEQADLLTGFPRQELHSWGERLLVPFFSWAFLCFTPLWLAYQLRLPALSEAVGQMMLFRREAYRTIGGHASIGASIVDDLALTRKTKAAGLRWRVASITDLVTCRMYSGSHAAFDGFARNYFAAFGFRLLPYSFAFVWTGVMFWEPLTMAALWIFGRAPQVQAIDLLVCIGLSVLLWLIPYAELGVSVGLGLLYPFTILANEVAAVQSLRLSFAGRLVWKGRRFARPSWKWL